MDGSSWSHESVLSLEEPCLNLGIDGASKQVSRADVLQAGPWAPLSALFSNPVEDHLICAGKLLKLTRSVLEGTRGRESLTLKKWFRELKTSKMQIAAEMQNRHCFYKQLQSNSCGGVHSASTHRGDTPENDPNYFTSESTFYTSGAVPLTILQRNTHKISSNSDYIQKADPISKIWGRGEDWEVKTLATRVWGPEFGSPESVEIRSCCGSSPVTPVLRRQRLAQRPRLS